MKIEEIKTRQGMHACTMEGIRHDHVVLRCPVPKHNHAASIEPTYQRTLNCHYTQQMFIQSSELTHH